MGILGGILFIVVIVLLVIYFSNKRKLDEMYAVDVSTTAALRISGKESPMKSGPDLLNKKRKLTE